MFKSDISVSFRVVIVTENEVPCCALTTELCLGGGLLFIEVFKWDSFLSDILKSELYLASCFGSNLEIYKQVSF